MWLQMLPGVHALVQHADDGDPLGSTDEENKMAPNRVFEIAVPDIDRAALLPARRQPLVGIPNIVHVPVGPVHAHYPVAQSQMSLMSAEAAGVQAKLFIPPSGRTPPACVP